MGSSMSMYSGVIVSTRASRRSYMTDIKSLCKVYWEAFEGGDESAFRMLYDLTYDELYRYAHRLTGQTITIRDVLQEMYVSMWSRRGKQPPVRDPWVFLLVALRNKVVDEARKQRKLRVVHPAEPSVEAAFVKAETMALRTVWLEDKLLQLPERQREAIHLRYRVELGYPEIAEVMGVGQQVAYNYVNRGVKQLRKVAADLPDWRK